MAKLHYDVHEDRVVVTLYEGEGWNAEGRKDLDTRTFPVADVPAALSTNDEPKSLAAYGLSKVLQERPSGEPDPAKKLELMDATFKTLSEGRWRDYAVGGGSKRGPKLDAIFVQAVAEIKKVKVPQAEAALRKLDAATIKKIRSLPDVKERMEKLRASAGDDDIDLGFDLPEGDDE